jgi:hypothetical protein
MDADGIANSDIADAHGTRQYGANGAGIILELNVRRAQIVSGLTQIIERLVDEVLHHSAIRYMATQASAIPATSTGFGIMR